MDTKIPKTHPSRVRFISNFQQGPLAHVFQNLLVYVYA